MGNVRELRKVIKVIEVREVRRVWWERRLRDVSDGEER